MNSYLKRIAWLLLPALLSLLVGALLILAAGQNPLLAYANLFEAGFSCKSGPGRCALVTALQFATPLILTGLSATVALRGGFFSVGQIGQMMFGAAAASWLAGNLSLPAIDFCTAPCAMRDDWRVSCRSQRIAWCTQICLSP